MAEDFGLEVLEVRLAPPQERPVPQEGARVTPEA
jgi:hypothetical protein